VVGTARSKSLSAFGLFEFCEDVRVALAGCEQIFKADVFTRPRAKIRCTGTCLHCPPFAVATFRALSCPAMALRLVWPAA
jgi:hypothetical protein